MYTPQQLVSEQIYNQFLDKLTTVLERPICQNYFGELTQKYVNDPNKMPTIIWLETNRHPKIECQE